MPKIGETFFTSVGCMDGRVYEPILKFGQKKFGARFADIITEAGLVGKLAQEPVNAGLLDSVRFKIVEVSLGRHHSKGIIVHGHQECAGNPVDDERHKDDIRKSVQLIQSLINSSIQVVGVFIKRSQNDPNIWEVEEIPSTALA